MKRTIAFIALIAFIGSLNFASGCSSGRSSKTEVAVEEPSTTTTTTIASTTTTTTSMTTTTTTTTPTTTTTSTSTTTTTTTTTTTPTTTTTKYKLCVHGCLDLVIAVDDSNSSSLYDFMMGLNAVNTLIERLDIGSGKNQTRVAFMGLSFPPRIIFGLSTYTTKKAVQYAIKSIRPKPNSGISFGLEMEIGLDTVFSDTREGLCKNVLVIITSGTDKYAARDMLDLSNHRLWAPTEITIFGFAVGPGPSYQRLKVFARSSETIFKVSDYSDLSKSITTIIC